MSTADLAQWMGAHFTFSKKPGGGTQPEGGAAEAVGGVSEGGWGRCRRRQAAGAARGLEVAPVPAGAGDGDERRQQGRAVVRVAGRGAATCRGGGAGGSAVAAVAAGLPLQRGGEAAVAHLQQYGPILSVDPPCSCQALRRCPPAPPLHPLPLSEPSPRRSIQTAARPL